MEGGEHFLMNEDPDSDSRRRKLIQYLLNEIPQEQKFEAEKLCNSELEWREKKQIQQCLILLEEAGKDGFKLDEKFLEELSFSSEEKKDLRIAFEQGSMRAASGSKIKISNLMRSGSTESLCLPDWSPS